VQFISIPTIGLVLVTITSQGILANRPVANGVNGYFYATDTQIVYYDNGAWIAVGGPGSSSGLTTIYNDVLYWMGPVS
jgi:hypothetical protein